MLSVLQAVLPNGQGPISKASSLSQQQRVNSSTVRRRLDAMAIRLVRVDENCPVCILQDTRGNMPRIVRQMERRFASSSFVIIKHLTSAGGFARHKDTFLTGH